jgi:hypothetical protein
MDPIVFCKFIPDCVRLPSLVAIFISVFDRLGDCSDCGTSTCSNSGTDADALAILKTRVLAVGAGRGSGKGAGKD